MAPPSVRSRIAAFFAPGGPLSAVLDGYEERPAQRKLSQAVAEVLDAGGLLLAEAGTGTGKTLAYLLPAVDVGRRVVVSTGTKNLQEQLVQKDIPILAKALGRDLDVAVMKGRGNYLCLLRFASFAKAGSFRRLEEVPIYRAVEAWAPQTQTGDRAEVPDMPDTVDFWREVSATSENCIGQSCPLFDSCFVTRMRQRAAESDLVIVNHHLLCADAAVRAVHALIVEEAEGLDRLCRFVEALQGPVLVADLEVAAPEVVVDRTEVLPERLAPMQKQPVHDRGQAPGIAGGCPQLGPLA